MSWYDASYIKQIWVAVDGSTTAAGTVDVEIDLTSDDADFWATIQADGDDVRASDASGLNGIDYDLESLNYAGQTVNVELDAVTHHVTNTITLVRLFFGYAAAANAEDGIVPASALTGYTLNVGPEPGETIYGLGSRPGDPVPAQTAQKRSTETAYLWFQIGPLGRRSAPYQGRLRGEEPQALSASTALLTVGGSGSLTAATSSIRVIELEGGAILARLTVSGGVTGNDYQVTLRCVTSAGRILEGTVRVTVADPA